MVQLCLVPVVPFSKLLQHIFFIVTELQVFFLLFRKTKRMTDIYSQYCAERHHWRAIAMLTVCKRSGIFCKPTFHDRFCDDLRIFEQLVNFSA